MITVRLCGGTGNQLWQRAFGYALEARGNEVVFDRSSYDTDDSRAYALDHWNTEVPFGPRCGREITEPDLTYHPELLNKYDEDVTLSGYFQCPKYLSGVEDQIRRAFTLRYFPSPESLAVANKIHQSNSVFLHVRRTDSLAARGLAFHGVCSGEYYAQAVSYMHAHAQDPRFLVFSDDIEWCKKNLELPAIFVDHNTTGVESLPDNEVRKTDSGTEHEDLWLMSRCKHGITANSSFSWWGAWLQQNSQKICLSPKQWFTSEHNDLSKDMIPWLRI